MQGRRSGWRRPSDKPRNKRKFSVTWHTRDKDTSATSTASKKIKNSPHFASNTVIGFKYFIVKLSLIFFLESNLICKFCKKDIKFSIIKEGGLGFELNIQCQCDVNRSHPSSPKIGSGYEINR